MMDIVIDASPLILLSKIGLLHLLNKLFDAVYIPHAVIQEIQAINKTEMKINITEISFIPFEISNKIAVRGLLGRLHMGESEVMIGAIEKGITTVVLDESAARNKAKQLGLEVTGTLGILLKAQKHGLIEDVGQEIIKLKKAGMYLSDEITQRVLNTKKQES